MGEFITFISNVGFPIACCCYMMYNNNKAIKELSDVVSANTATVESLKEKIGGIYNE